MKKNIMEELNITLFYIHSSLATFVFIFALEINVHGTNFFDRGQMEGDHNLLVSNFTAMLVFMEFSQEIY